MLSISAANALCRETSIPNTRPSFFNIQITVHKVDKESYVSDLLLLLFLIQADSYSVKVVQTI